MNRIDPLSQTANALRKTLKSDREAFVDALVVPETGHTQTEVLRAQIHYIDHLLGLLDEEAQHPTP